MNRTLKRKLKKLWKRRKRAVFAVIAVCALMCATAYITHQFDMKKSIDPTAFAPVLNLIAKAESNGNYNAYFGHPDNTAIDFTSMPIADVMRWQTEFIQQGSPSSAVGRYQIINTTLAGLVRRLN